MATRQKVVVGMSGGVDSSLAAALLLEQDYDVQGVSLRMWEGESGPRVCSDYHGAEEVAQYLGIPYELLDLRAQFADTVVKPFARAYLHGRTPNPCVACNRDFKLGTLLDWAKQRGADYVATGHYARIARTENDGHWRLYRGADRRKDQSYFLFALSQKQLSHTLFPLGGLSKDEVREHARRRRLPAAERPESQDICFGEYKTLVESYAQAGELEPGEVIDRCGHVLGAHRGIHSVTVGQRKGVGISGAQRLYVVEIDDGSKRIVVGSKEDLACSGLYAHDINGVEPLAGEFEAEVQIRYRAPALPCVVRLTGGDRCEVRFREPCGAVAPGQAAVFYRGERVLGGGWIERAIKA